jgi:hypothetical protein
LITFSKNKERGEKELKRGNAPAITPRHFGKNNEYNNIDLE